MRAGLWISDSAGSARSVKPLHMKRTNVGSFSKCMKEGCIFDPNKGCENSIAVGAKPFTHDSECYFGSSQTGNHNPNQNWKCTAGDKPNKNLKCRSERDRLGFAQTGLRHQIGCIPSAYCADEGTHCRIKTVNTAATDDPNHVQKQCAFRKDDAEIKCQAWDLCVGVICGGRMGDYCLGKY